MIRNTTSEVRISHLRLRRAGPDAGAARARAAALLAAADLRPPGLPPAAILCVRRLRDPLPGALPLSGGALRPPAAWQRAVAAELGRLARAAARPAHGPVPAGAEAVLFADRAELLACLAADWRAGALGARWWWRGLLRSADATAVLAAWVEAPAYIPVALEQLAARGEAVAFAQALGQAPAAALLHALAHGHGLTPLLTAVAPLLAGAAPAAAPGQEPPLAPDAPPWQHWADDGASAGLAPTQRCLLGLGLALRRAPAAVYAPPFAAALRCWAEGLAEPAPPAPGRAEPAAPRPPAQPGTPDRPDPPAPQIARGVYPGAAPTAPHGVASEIHSASVADGPAAAERPRPGLGHAKQPMAPPPASDQQPRPSRALPPARAGQRGEAPPEAGADRHPDAPLPPPAETSRPADAQARVSSPVVPSDRAVDTGPGVAPGAAEQRDANLIVPPDPGPQAAPVAAPLVAAPQPGPGPELHPIASAYGGVFYLINLALALELYGDFTSPARPGITLPIWDFIALVGHRLLGRALADDPLWPLLARLAGRDLATPPGAGFAPPGYWRIPPVWLEPFPTAAPWPWQVRGGRLSVWHPAGFVAIDLPRDGDPAAQLARELAAYGAQPRTRPADHGERIRAAASSLAHGRRTPPGARPRPLPRGAPPYAQKGAKGHREDLHAPLALARWLGWLLPYLEARLRQALATRGSGLGRLLCAHQARIYLTGSHLDVVIGLADLPIAIRLAGLDRTPGWVPAAGRYVAFHFE